MSLCPHCGAALPQGANFCGACGKSARSPAAPPAPAAPGVSPTVAAPPVAPPPAGAPTLAAEPKPHAAPATPTTFVHHDTMHEPVTEAPHPLAPEASAARGTAPSVRPIGVTIIAVLQFIAGAFGVFAGLVLIMGGSTMGLLLGAGLGGILVLAAMFVFAFAALVAFSGWGLLRGRNWAWILTVVFTALGALGNVLAILQGDLGSIVGIALGALVLWYFFTPDVRAWFGHGVAA